MSLRPPLDGVRVVDLSRLLPGAFCTLLLADLGADVIKIEDPQGGDLMRTLPPQVGGLSVYHHALNRNKRSVTLDLRAADALAVLDRLLAGADVVVESFRPQTAKRLKVSAEDLAMRHPRLVHCSLTGFGQQGPYAERAAHDLDFVALAGLFQVDQPELFGPPSPRRGSGKAGGTPARARVPRLLVADIGGAWAAAAGILAALFQRERTGRSSAIDVAMHDVAVSWLTFPAASAMIHASGQGVTPLPITGDAACYNVYATADGRYLAVAAIEKKFWHTFCQRVGHPELIDVQFAPAEQDRLRAKVSGIVASRTLRDWLALFADTDVCLAPVNSIPEALAEAHLAARGAVAPHGASTFVRTPIVFDRGGTRLPIVPAAALGADTDEVLRSSGIDDQELAALRSRRVI